MLREIESIVRKKKLPYYRDKSGNLIVGIRSAAQLRTGRRLLLFAHTDHPGFHIIKQKGRRVFARWLGGAPFSQMVGAKMAIYDPATSHKIARARVIKFKKVPYKRSGLKIEMTLFSEVKLPQHAFGAFDFVASKIQRNTITTRVADDLAGCVIALGTVLDVKKQGSAVAIFTRAEEIGYIGCLAWLRAHRVSSESLAISLEASKELPGAIRGKGPVLRLGDRSTLFDQAASQFLLKCTQRAKIPYQRRIMDGGSCEATALNAFGIRTTGISVPLKNYHNQGMRGPAPEVIDLRDVEHARRICVSVSRRLKDFEKTSDELTKALQKNFSSLKKYLTQYHEALL